MKSVFKQRKKALDFPKNPLWEAVSENTKSPPVLIEGFGLNEVYLFGLETPCQVGCP